MPTPRLPRSLVAASGAAGLFGLLALSGCQQSDLETTDVQSRSIDSYVTSHSAEGKVEHRIWSMLDGTEKFTTHLRYPNPDGPRDLEVEVVFPEGIDIERDTWVLAHGEFDAEGRLVADDVEELAPPPLPIIDPEWHPLRRIALILVFWGDTGGLPNAPARASMFTDDKSTHVFYAENSYGKENIIGETFGPYQIAEPTGCQTGFIANAAQAAMVEKGHDPNNFIQFMYHFPSLGGCGFSGLASVGSPLNPAADSWYNGSLGCVVRNQELGHNYGMGHSHAYNCEDAEGNDVPLSDTCDHIEYGHPYDPMGGGCGHINNVQKTFMGWLEGCNVVSAPADGTFNLMPTELPCTGTQSLKFPTSDGRSYYLEYRRPLGRFDTNPGVLLHVAPTTFGGGPANYILDVGDNGFLKEGDTYTDPEGTVSFTIVEELETHAVVRVTYPDGGSGSPTCDDGSTPEMAGGNVGTLECAAEPVAGDVVPPEVTITFPEEGAYFEPGSDFKIIAEATDDRVVADVELYVNGESFFKLLEEPWEYSVEGIPEGDYEFGIVARDGVNWTPSNAVNVHITNDIPEMPGEDDTGGDEAADDDAAADDMADAPGGEETGASDDETGGDDAGATDPSSDTCSVANTGGRGAPTAVLVGLILLGLRRRFV